MTVIDAVYDLFQRQFAPIILSFLVLIPFLTHYLSTSSFYRTVNGRSSKRYPPTLPYWIPGVYHAIPLARNPATYFARVIREYGQHAPFVVKAGTVSFLLVRNPDDVQNVLQAPRQLTMSCQLLRIHKILLGSPKEALEVYKGITTGREDSERVEQSHFALPRRYLTGTALISLTEVYISTLRRNLSSKMFQARTWTQIEDLWSFFEIEITRAIVETLLGSALLKQYPRVAQDYWKFASRIDELSLALPLFLVSSVDTARNKLLENIKAWLQATHGGTNFARTGAHDPIWDAQKGSKFIQEQDEIFAKIPFSYSARASEVFGVMHSVVPETVPSVFWCIVEALRDEKLIPRLRGELSPHYTPQTGLYDIARSMDLPIIQSLVAETGRLRKAACTFRTSGGTDFAVGEAWAIPRGTSIIIFSQDVGLNTKLWATGQPHTISKPLEQFWAERFLVPDVDVAKTDKGTTSRRSEVSRFSMEGVQALHVSYTNDPFYSFSAAIQAATLAVLLTEFEPELCDLDATQQALPRLRETAYGIVKPLDKIAIRIRKRNDT